MTDDYPLTPQMRAALAIDQRAVAIGAACFPVVVILLALVVALIDCRPLAEIPRFLLLVGAWSALITFGIWACRRVALPHRRGCRDLPTL